ncbi:Potential acrAB operon repressor [Chlamydia abortus]|uniref:TetR/AcrR family transcriptional regulator n=1 Tax=Paenibacillus residui TaxID=629724 RepID=A0ABW3D4V8_9BACL|nr:TetR/AcrR family transcriptional regulator [Paenibacillus sp. 32O-W]SHE15167.1 Potential acrAB operon repressor [Chlamydia abortus]
MARKFSDHEKERIRERLVEAGKQCFGLYGLKKTSIEQLTKAAGIAQGTFYLFFPSKEELYFELLELEEERVRRQLLEETEESGRMDKEKLVRFLRKSLTVIGENPFFRQLYEEDVMEQLVRKLPPEKLAAHFDKDADVAMPFVRRWQEEGWLTSQRPEIIVSLIRSLILLTLQKRMIGEEVFDETMELLIQLIAQGLTAE